jgi:hypothetical protein
MSVLRSSRQRPARFCRIRVRANFSTYSCLVYPAASIKPALRTAFLILTALQSTAIAQQSINSFIGCVNNKLMAAANANASVDISTTISCISHNCSVTGTLSNSSDQKACSLPAGANTVFFPRIILYCPGTMNSVEFLPSYLLCPEGGTESRMELADVVAGNPLMEMGALAMADLSLDPGVPPPGFKIDAAGIKNQVTNGQNNDPGTKGCNACHDDGTPRTQNQAGTPPLLLAKPISPFTTSSTNKRRFNGMNFAQSVIFTTQPGQKPNPMKTASLTGICATIFFNRQGLLATNPFLTEKDLDVTLNLCRRMRERSLFFDAADIKADANDIDPPSFDLRHGKLGNSFVITVKNFPTSSPLTIDVASMPFADFISGDMNDFVANIRTTGGTCLKFGTGNPLQPGASCTIIVTFDTGPADGEKGAKPDVGIWDIVTRVTLTSTKNTANRIDLLPTVTVKVRP